LGQPDLGAEEKLSVEVGGVIVAAVTPRRKDGREVDVAAALELIDFLCAAGVKGIALLGSTGEFLNLTFDERVRLAYMAGKRSRMPMLVGVGHSSFDGAVELGREAVGSGAAGLLLMPPYFFRYGQEDIREFYLRFAAQMPENTRIFLYNIPFFTNELAPETAAGLLATGLFAGIKDSSGRMEYFDHIAAARAATPFTLLVGNDVVFTKARTAGADGVVSGVACAVPELMLGLDRAICADDQAKIGQLETRLQEFIRWLDRLPTPLGVKAATEARGLQVGPPAVPLSPGSIRALNEFTEWFLGWLPEVKKEAGDG
jgi:dihydrodipicolinate synthase/N-acetylneuraminate lyase